MDQGSNKNHSPAYNFTPTVTKFCVMWEGLSLPHDTKFGNCRCKIVDSRSFHSWSLIHGLRWSGLIKVGPEVLGKFIIYQCWKWIPEIGLLKSIQITPDKNVKWTNEPINILRVKIAAIRNKTANLNFPEKISKIETILNIWCERNLSVFGKLTMIKFLAYSLVVYLLSVPP